jgi:Domain of unknown function (DUF4136)
MKKKTLRLLSGIAVATIILTGCASVAHVEKDNNADFSKYKTFYWIDKDGSGKQDHNKRNDLTEQNVRAAVNKELQKEGWKESKNDPDILLSYDVLVEKNVKQQNDPVYSRPFSRTFYNPYSRRYINVFYPSQFQGYDNYEVPVKEGTITITMTDSHTDKMVWQGWTTDEVNSRNLTNKEIQNSVKSIFRKFDTAKR